MKKITVIIPVYNCEKHLAETLESLEKQTIFEQLKFIIIDDSSTDGSYELLLDFKQKYANSVILIKNDDNKGVSFSRNVALKLLDTDYFSFIDADDVVVANYYEKMLFLAEEHDADLIILNQVFYQDGNIRDINSLSKTIMFLNGEEAQEHFILNKNISNSSCDKLFRRTIADGIFFDENLKVAEDMKFIYDYLRKCRKTVLDFRERDYFYIQHSGSAMNINHFDNKFLDTLTVLNYMKGISDEKYQKLIDSRLLKENAYLVKRLMLSNNSKEFAFLVKDYKKRFRQTDFVEFAKQFSSANVVLTVVAAYLSPKLIFGLIKLKRQLKYSKG